ncbi:MAG: hypothetical protein CR982_05435 [Candidatus Cloacimonadota bacterium]|nr:MAG: hypothetical protein CR982_05435 [Candidatus Cloacimonadota bacterium]PIE77590.1 MAG: hypothetical protein CSA15_12190 [Candidatus Delongbacteria bacterium]
MKIVFTTIPMKESLTAMKYPVVGNRNLEYDREVLFPVNSVLAKSLKENERVKIVMILNNNGFSEQNAKKFEMELKEINKNINADLSFHYAIENFEESKQTHEARFRKIIEFLEEDAEIIADITYGQKTLPLILFSVMNFAEKFFNNDILYIVYGKVEFENNNILKNSQKLYDLTPLYYLNALTSAMEAPDGKSAIKIVDNFFSL